MNKIIKVEKTDNDYIITEKDGTQRHIWNLHCGQKIGFYNGYHYYKKEEAENYFEKAALLKLNGQYQWYHYDYWVHPEKTKNIEYGGLNTDNVLEKLREETL